MASIAFVQTSANVAGFDSPEIPEGNLTGHIAEKSQTKQMYCLHATNCIMNICNKETKSTNFLTTLMLA